MKYSIEVKDVVTNQVKSITKADGYLLLYLENEEIKSNGNIELRALAPLVKQAILSKLM